MFILLRKPEIGTSNKIFYGNHRTLIELTFGTIKAKFFSISHEFLPELAP